jgi:preprotein translocase subunit YajC
MHALLHLIAAGTTTTTKASKKSSGSTYTLLFIVVIFGAVYFLFLRPRQQKMRQQQSAAKQLSIGDQVVSAGGICGRVVAMDGDVAEVEVAPGVVLTFLRRAVNARPDAPPGAAAPPIEDEWPGDRDRAADPDPEDEPPEQPDPHS